jgi:hypothetical protein
LFRLIEVIERAGILFVLVMQNAAFEVERRGGGRRDLFRYEMNLDFEIAMRPGERGQAHSCDREQKEPASD